MKGREARDREFLSFLCCDIFVYGEKWQDKERHKKIMCNFSWFFWFKKKKLGFSLFVLDGERWDWKNQKEANELSKV